MRELLLAWFACTARDLPWRRTRDPYAILVSEVMLQQTQVERVVPRYARGSSAGRRSTALAAASPADVIREWQGLGYNRRAVNLHRAAAQVAAGGWPDDLTELPGVGPYTAAAVANFAFGEPCSRSTRTSGASRSAPASVRRRLRAGADGPRRDGLPGARAALRRLPPRGRMPVARPALRAAPEAVARSRARSASAARPRCDSSRRRASLDELDGEAVRALERDAGWSRAASCGCPATPTRDHRSPGGNEVPSSHVTRRRRACLSRNVTDA